MPVGNASCKCRGFVQGGDAPDPHPIAPRISRSQERLESPNKTSFFLPLLRWKRSLPGLGENKHPKSRDVPTLRGCSTAPWVSALHQHDCFLPLSQLLLPQEGLERDPPGETQTLLILTLILGG